MRKITKENFAMGGAVSAVATPYESPSVSCFEAGMQECLCASPNYSSADEPDDYVYGGTL